MTSANHVWETGSVVRVKFITHLLVPGLVCVLFVPAPGQAEQTSLLNLSIRARVSSETVLGKDQPEQLDEYDIAANLQLPWKYHYGADWAVTSRLMASAGVMRGGGEEGLVFSLIPGIAWGREDNRFSVDAGAGAALLGRHQFGTQDFGGPLQIALTAGANFRLYKQFGIGYRFLHYSDAGLHGSDSVGADFHMIEFSYWFLN